MTESGIVSFVLSSTARREVLLELDEGDATASTLVGATSASESAGYDAINKLDDRGLIEGTDGDQWTLTGAGRLVVELLEQSFSLDDVIESNLEYWQTHDPAGLPERFRRSLDRIEGCRVVESPDTDPYRAARRVKEAIEDATDEVSIVAPIYDERRAEAFLDCNADLRRILMTPDMVERLLRDDPDQPDRSTEGTEIRVDDADIAMVVTGSELLFSLPRCDGSYDATTEVLAETDAAVEWGQQLFETYWADAPTVETFVAEQWPELIEEMSQ